VVAGLRLQLAPLALLPQELPALPALVALLRELPELRELLPVLAVRELLEPRERLLLHMPLIARRTLLARPKLRWVSSSSYPS